MSAVVPPMSALTRFPRRLFIALSLGRATLVLALAFLALTVTIARAQQQGPLPPPSSGGSSGSPGMTSSGSANAAAKSEVHDESEITNTPPAIPAEQIIAKFSQHESEFRDERANYAYTQTFIFQTLDSDDVPDGEYRLVTDLGFTSEGTRYDQDAYAP